MLPFHLNEILELARETGRLSELYAKWDPPTGTLQGDVQKRNIATMNVHAKTFDALGLHMCRLKCEQISRKMGRPANELASAFNDLAERMFDECKLRKFVSLSVKQAEMSFPSEPLFGSEVDILFPAAAFDIEEAGKCLGFARPTAAVFHCMRVMEVGIAAIARSLGIPDPIKPAERNWAIILKRVMEDGIKKKWPAASDRINGEGAFFEELYASLDAVRNPWRNATMHVGIKYSDEEAEHIFIAVRGFMKKIASRMDEDGTLR